MVLRYCCLYEDKKIGIESIYTVSEGRQINIKDKIEKLRDLGRQKKLFCPCGCGSNLFLVAGSKGLKRQHFRIEKGKANMKCTFARESEECIDSKIVLKCWIDDKLKLKEDDVQSRVQADKLSKTNHKYELTFYIKKYHIGLSFINLDSYLKDKKIEILEEISKVNIIYVVSSFNESDSWQYPEYLKKIQRVQNYCLFVKLCDDNSYSKAEMRAVAYFQKSDESWKKVILADGLLTEFEVNEKGEIFFKGIRLIELLSQERNLFVQEQEELQQKNKLKKNKKRYKSRNYLLKGKKNYNKKNKLKKNKKSYRSGDRKKYGKTAR